MRFLRRRGARALVALVLGALVGLAVAGVPDRSSSGRGVDGTDTTIADSEVPTSPPEVEAP